MDGSDPSSENDRSTFPSHFDMPAMGKSSSMSAQQGMNFPFYGMFATGGYGIPHGNTSIDDSAMVRSP